MHEEINISEQEIVQQDGLIKTSFSSVIHVGLMQTKHRRIPAAALESSLYVHTNSLKIIGLNEVLSRNLFPRRENERRGKKSAGYLIHFSTKSIRADRTRGGNPTAR